MKIIEKKFTKEHLNSCEEIKKYSNERFSLNPVNNICLILQKLKDLKNIEGDYVECGTYRGSTLIPTALYSSITGFFKNKKLIGIDTFNGFPVEEHDERDLPSYFKILYQSKLITKDHYNKAKKRTNNFKSLSHLKNNYFLDIKEIFDICSLFPNVSLLKGTFQELTPKFDRKIAILYLDGDLYESYLVCLNNLYQKVTTGGVIIFDEYYSHKYPGARVVVDEFFENEIGYFEKYITKEGHERWCFIKQ